MLIHIFYISPYVWHKAILNIIILIHYNNIWVGKASKPYTIQGINTTYAIIKGKNTVQQTDINWSKRILGKEALTQINTNIKKAVFNAKFIGEEEICTNISNKIVLFTFINKLKILINISKGIILK